MSKLTVEQRLIKEAGESIESAARILREESDGTLDLQSIRNAAAQATQAANDLNILYGVILAKRG